MPGTSCHTWRRARSSGELNANLELAKKFRVIANAFFGSGKRETTLDANDATGIGYGGPTTSTSSGRDLESRDPGSHCRSGSNILEEPDLWSALADDSVFLSESRSLVSRPRIAEGDPHEHVLGGSAIYAAVEAGERAGLSPGLGGPTKIKRPRQNRGRGVLG